MESKGIVKGQFTDWSTHFRGSKNVKIQCFSGSMSLNPLRSGSYNAPRHFKLSSFSWSFLIYMFFSGEKSQFNYFFLFQCFTCNRNSRSYVLHKEGVFKNFGKFPGEHLDWSLIKFNKVAGRRPVFLFKKIWHRCFQVNFAKFLKTPIL